MYYGHFTKLPRLTLPGRKRYTFSNERRRISRDIGGKNGRGTGSRGLGNSGAARISRQAARRMVVPQDGARTKRRDQQRFPDHDGPAAGGERHVGVPLFALPPPAP